MGVPVYIGFSGSGLQACRTSKQLVRSTLGGLLLLVGFTLRCFPTKRAPIWVNVPNSQARLAPPCECAKFVSETCTTLTDRV
eukprot:scaffold22612_cov138-Cylindrotheca_fusiformis.AAC.6